MNLDLRILRQAAAWCLRYPDDEVISTLPVVAQAVAEVGPSHAGAADALRGFLSYASGAAPLELAAHYVTVFDLRNRRSLYLSWWSDGDTRRRGMSLVGFKSAYREAGLEYTGTELPDYLPAVLEFTASGEAAALRVGEQLLAEYHRAITTLSAALTKLETPYAGVLDAVCATLPAPSESTRKALLEPATEFVGLDPYAGIVMGAGR